MSAFSPIGTNTSIGGADYCVVGGFAYPGRCASPQVPSVPPVSVPFGVFGLPVDRAIAVDLEQPPTGPQVIPSSEVSPENPTASVDPEQDRAASVLDRLAMAKRSEKTSTLPTPENPWFFWWLLGAAAVWAAWRLSK